jgi:hypothetical protein
MATKKEFIEWLNQFPEDTLIEFKGKSMELPEIQGNDEFRKSIWGSNDIVDVTDFRFNQYVKPNESWFGKIIINFEGE